MRIGRRSAILLLTFPSGYPYEIDKSERKTQRTQQRKNMRKEKNKCRFLIQISRYGLTAARGETFHGFRLFEETCKMIQSRKT